MESNFQNDTEEKWNEKNESKNTEYKPGEYMYIADLSRNFIMRLILFSYLFIVYLIMLSAAKAI
jgi:hypothetical protein